MAGTTTAKPNPTPPPPPQSKRSKPKASPEFAQARIKRDLRLLLEREQSLREAFHAKVRDIEAKRNGLLGELAAVEAALTPAAPGKGDP